MCPKCQGAKNKRFHRVVMGWSDISIDEIEEAFNEAFGEGTFKQTDNNRRVNFDAELQCQYCGEKFHIRS